MRVLVLGGTVFLGRAVATEALRRGHDVVCVARGESADVPSGAHLVRADRDVAGALEPLAGERFDAVVDTAIMSHRWVADALDVLASAAAHWTFVSSISVYADQATPGQGADAPLLAPRDMHSTVAERAENPAPYGEVKVASENAVRDAVGKRAFIVRPGLITGPGDHTDRFGYWPARFARGGRVAVPDVPRQLTQFVDVRDLAAWIVDAGERRLAGTFDAISPARPLPDVLRGMAAHDHRPAANAGLWTRPLADAVAGALAQEITLGIDRERQAGLTPAEETDVLARWVL